MLHRTISSLILALLAAAQEAPLHGERYHYDDPGRLIRVIYTDLSSITYTYDPNGNITEVDVTQAGTLNDADLDGDVDGDDYAAILQLTLDGDYVPTADCNTDETVSVLDLVCFVGVGPPVGAAPTLAADDVDAMQGETGVPTGLSLTGAGGASPAVQTDVLYDPAILTPGTATAGAASADHLVATALAAPGRLRVVVYSPTNAALGSGEAAVLSWDVDAAAPFGMTPLGLTAATAAGPDASALQPLTLAPGEVHVFQTAADLEVTKIGPTVRVANGDEVTFTVVATNLGPAAVTGAEVTDLLPIDLVGVSWSCVATGGATCTANGVLDVMDTVDLPVGGSVTYTVVGTVDSLQETFDNLATVTAPAEVVDPEPGNDSDLASVDVCLLQADLVLDDPAFDPITDAQQFHACRIVAGPQFSVGPGGDVLLHGEISVSLESGFASVDGDLEVRIDPPPP